MLKNKCNIIKYVQEIRVENSTNFVYSHGNYYYNDYYTTCINDVLKI